MHGTLMYSQQQAVSFAPQEIQLSLAQTTIASHYRLPDALDVDKFVQVFNQLILNVLYIQASFQTRAYEIKAMEDGIKSAK